MALCSAESDISSDSEEDSSECDCDSNETACSDIDDDKLSPPSFSPISTSSESETEDDESADIPHVKISKRLTSASHTSQDQALSKKHNSEEIERSQSFKIVGDNVDKNVTPRYLRINHRVKSLHYYHSFAVQDRIDVSNLSDEIASSCLLREPAHCFLQP